MMRLTLDGEVMARLDLEGDVTVRLNLEGEVTARFNLEVELCVHGERTVALGRGGAGIEREQAQRDPGR